MIKIGILGSGPVGKSLGEGFKKYGYELQVGTRSEDRAELDLWGEKEGINTGSLEEAAEFGEVIVLAVNAIAAENVMNRLSDLLKGKIVIDTTNPISEEPPVNGVLKYFTSLDESLMERLQSQQPDIRYVKAFSCVGFAHMVDPDFGDETPTMFICGNDDSAKDETIKILETFGWEVEDMGKVEAARAIEPLCILVCIPGFLRNEWDNAIKLLKK